MNGRLTRDTLLRSVDIPNTDDLDLGDTDVGLVDREVRRVRLELRPSWTRAVTQRTSIRLDYRLTDESFSDEEGTGLQDNDTHVLGARWSKELSQRNSVSFGARIGRNRVPDTDSTTDDVSILGEITHVFSPTLEGTLSAGFRDTTFERGALEETDSGTVCIRDAISPNASALANATRYSDNDEQDDLNEQIIRLRSRGEASERSRWKVNGRLTRDTLLRSVDIPNTDDLDLGDTDVGLVDREVRRVRLELRPSWTRAVTQRTSIRLDYRLTDESFSDEEGTGLQDNDTHVLGARWSKELSQRNSVSFGARIGRNRVPDTDSTTDDVSILGEITHVFSPTLEGTLSVGRHV